MLRGTRLISNTTVQRFQHCRLRIGILHSGGPAPGGNLVFNAVGRRAMDHGIKALGFHSGYQFLLDAPVVDVVQRHSKVIDERMLDRLSAQDSLYFGTSRANPGRQIKTADDMADPAKTAPLTRLLHMFDEMNLGALVCIGGDDTMRTSNLLQQHLLYLTEKARQTFRKFMGVVHVPKTIDNDYNGIPFTFGFWTAADTIYDSLHKLHNDARGTGNSNTPVYHIVDIMGRKAGFLNAAASLPAEVSYTFLPEDYAGRDRLSLQELVNDFVDVILTRRLKGKHYGVITFSEGLKELVAQEMADRDDFGHVRLDSIKLSLALQPLIVRELVDRVRHAEGLTINPKILTAKRGYDARQATPIIPDRILCSILGLFAVDSVLQGQFGQMVTVDGEYNPGLVPFDRLIDPRTLTVTNRFMSEESGLLYALRASQEPFQHNVYLD